MDPAHFLRRPTKEAWRAELVKGWHGPNGSSWSFDSIFGVRIGKTSVQYRYASLPANLHDWRYQQLRRLQAGGTPRKVLRRLQQKADLEYRLDCISRVRQALIGWRVAVARLTAWRRYFVLRLLGWRAWSR
jgi:hypothetical protein